jgi:hypothetical protein
MAVEAYDVSHISKKLNLKTSDLISILVHARIEVIDNCVPHDDNNSIHAAKQNTKFYLPQNAKNYILAA